MNESSARRRRAAIAMALTLGAQLAWMSMAFTAPMPTGTNTAQLPAGPSLNVQLQVTISLRALHPGATNGALVCGAVGQSLQDLDAHGASLSSYDGMSRWVLSAAHYYGLQAPLEFTIANRAFDGTLTYRATLTPQMLTDPVTHERLPKVLVGCWLSINGRPAVRDLAGGLQVVSASNLAVVSGNPSVLAVGDTGRSVNLTANLTAQGALFVPGAVAVSAKLSPAGPKVAASSAVGTNTAQLPATSVANLPTMKNAPPPPVSNSLQSAVNAQSVPAVTGLRVDTSDAAVPVLTWSCLYWEYNCFVRMGTFAVDCDTLDCSGLSSYNYEVWSRKPGASAFTPIGTVDAHSLYLASVSGTPWPAGLGITGDCGEIDFDGGCVGWSNMRWTLSLDSTVTGGTTFRVIRKDPGGGALQKSAEVVY
jgi:hypothetical protein